MMIMVEIQTRVSECCVEETTYSDFISTLIHCLDSSGVKKLDVDLYYLHDKYYKTNGLLTFKR